MEKIAVHLADKAKLKPWLDRWEMIPGESAIDQLERGLTTCQACAVFVGVSGKGPWQDKEVETALRRQIKSKEFRVIPVLLPGRTEKVELPPFLGNNIWIDLRHGLTDDHTLWCFECGIQGKPPGRGRPKNVEPQATESDILKTQFEPSELVIPGGAIEPVSRFYISRDEDEEVFFALQRPRALITICGPRQSGKTSLMKRMCAAIKHSRDALRVVFIDFQELPSHTFINMETLWLNIAQAIADQLQFDDIALSDWKSEGGYNRNFSRFLKQAVFESEEKPLLLCLDEVDRVFNTSICQEFFAAIRAFYNRGAMDQNLKNLRWMLGTSTEPAFFIEDISQSPFNIGYRASLNCFTPVQVDVFAQRHGLSVDAETLDKIMRYLGGRPYLVHLLFYHWVRKPSEHEKLFDAKTAGNGIFKTHLHHYLMHFDKEPEMAAQMQAIIAGKACIGLKMEARFESAGLVKRDENQQVVPICDLYATFFALTLGLHG